MMEADKQARGELVIKEHLDDEEENQVEVLQNCDDEESTQRGSGLPKNKSKKKNIVTKLKCKKISEKMKVKTENRKKIKKTIEENKKIRTKEAKLFPCDKCNVVSQSSANLKKHQMTHTGEKPYECTTCHKAFRQHHHLADHCRTHSGERPFKCEECGRRFVQKSSLNLHKKRHLGIKPFSCAQCSFATHDKVQLRVHMRTHTGEKPYQCEKCGRAFSTSTRLRFHHMIHTGEKRYKCEKCGVPFREKSTLQAHMAVHMKVGPFKCEECGQEFSRLAGLTLHRKVHDNKHNFLYVCNKEARQSFKSACKKTSHKETADTKDLSRKPKRIRSSETLESVTKDLPQKSKRIQSSETEPDAISKSPTKTPEQEGRAAGECVGQGTPVTPAKQPVSCLPLESKSSSSNGTDLQHKLKKILSSNIKNSLKNCASNVRPDQVKEALKKGTVLETQGDDGKDFFIVLPPSLQHKGILVLTDSQQTTTKASLMPDSSMTLEDRRSVSGEQIYPNILSENVLDTHETLYSSDAEAQECDMDSLEIEEEVCSAIEGETEHPYEVTSVECMLNTDSPNKVLQSVSRYSEATEKRLHPDGTSLLLWKDNRVNRFTNVTHIIEDGKEEPIVIHTQEESCIAELRDALSIVKGQRKQQCNGRKHIVKKRERDNEESGNSVPGKINFSGKKVKVKKQKPQRVYNCELCGKACKTSSNYISHLRIHSGERPYFCSYCKAGFKQLSHLRAHTRIHTRERPYACSVCNASFTQSSRLTSHKKTVHAEPKREIEKKKTKYVPENRVKNFFCRYCNKTFIGECLKIDHMKLHRPSSPYACKLCGKEFRSKNSLQYHSTKHSDFNHVCEICGVEMLSLKELHKHKVTDHGRNMSNSDMVDMQIHVKIGEEKDLVILNPALKDWKGIEVKRESFNDPESGLCELNQDLDGGVKSGVEVTPTHLRNEQAIHDITHTSPEKDNNTQQEEGSNFIGDSQNLTFCPDQGTQEGEVKGNKYIIHTDKTGKKTWECKVCNRSFTQSSNMHCHMRMHTGDKPFQCNVCQKSFRQIAHLKDHMKCHTGAKPHECSECGLCFTQRSAVKRHIRNLHGGDGVALKKSETDVRNQIIDAQSREYKSVPEDSVLEDKDEQLSKLLCKESVCKVCQKQFTDFSKFTVHIRRCGKRKQIKKVVHRCGCGKKFFSAARLLAHQKACDFLEDDSENFEDETVKIPTSGEKLENDFRTSGCEDDIEIDSEKCNDNKKSADNTTAVTQNNFKCKQCGEVLPDITSYKTHLEGHGVEGHHLCVLCGEVFRRASALRSHQSIKHGRKDRRYKDFSPTGYINNQEEDWGEESVEIKSEVDSEESFSLSDEEGKEEESFSLSDGEGKEERVSNVDLNAPVKRRKINFKCETRQGLKSTKRGVLGIANDKNDKWIGNGKKSSLRFGKNVVRKSKISEKSANIPNPSAASATLAETLVSDDDGDSHATSSKVKGNKKNQSDAGFYCKYCDKHFTDPNSCKKHMSSHDAEKPFKCEHCLLTFKRKAHLFNHYRRHAREENL